MYNKFFSIYLPLKNDLFENILINDNYLFEDKEDLNFKNSNFDILELQYINNFDSKYNLINTLDNTLDLYKNYNLNLNSLNYEPHVSNNNLNYNFYKADNIISDARKLIGTNYRWGGTSSKTGFDCSGLIQYVFKENGILLPRTVKEMEKVGKEILLDQIKPGDIICLSSSGPSGKHVKLVSDVKENKIYTIESKGKKSGVVESELSNSNKIITIRRVIDQNNLKINSKQDYINLMYLPLYKALQNNNLDASKYIYILIALTAFESRWGKSKLAQNNNNFGGIKGPGTKYNTREVNNLGKLYNTISSFKSYNSILDFANDYVKLLKNKFHAFEGSPNDFIKNIKLNGYFTESLSKYQASINSIKDDIKNKLN